MIMDLLGFGLGVLCVCVWVGAGWGASGLVGCLWVGSTEFPDPFPRTTAVVLLVASTCLVCPRA